MVGVATVSEHEEAESEILFLGGGVAGVETVSFGALPLSPSLEGVKVEIIFLVNRSSRRIQSLQSHKRE